MSKSTFSCKKVPVISGLAIDCARKANIPVLNKHSLVADALQLMSANKLGVACIVDSNFSLVGVVTDGDIRRRLILGNRSSEAFMGQDVINFVGGDPITIDDNATMSRALEVFMEQRVWDLPIVNQNKSLVGILHLRDFLIQLFAY